MHGRGGADEPAAAFLFQVGGEGRGFDAAQVNVGGLETHGVEESELVALTGKVRELDARAVRGEAAEAERVAVERAIAETPAERRRFAVFSLGRIPLAVQLGFTLGDRARAAVCHYDRDRGSWQWAGRDDGAAGDLAVTGRARKRSEEAVLRVSLSARVGDVPVTGATEIEIAAGAPSVRWLRREAQLAELAERALGEAWERVVW